MLLVRAAIVRTEFATFSGAITFELLEKFRLIALASILWLMLVAAAPAVAQSPAEDDALMGQVLATSESNFARREPWSMHAMGHWSNLYADRSPADGAFQLWLSVHPVSLRSTATYVAGPGDVQTQSFQNATNLAGPESAMGRWFIRTWSDADRTTIYSRSVHGSGKVEVHHRSPSDTQTNLVPSAVNPVAMLDGVVNAEADQSVTLFQLLRKADDRRIIRSATSTDYDTYVVISGTTNTGRITAWFDRDHRWTLRRIMIERKAADHYYGKTIAQLWQSSGALDDVRQTVTYDFTEVGQLGDDWLPVGMHSTTTTADSSRTLFTGTFDASRDLSLGLNIAGASRMSTIDIPDDTETRAYTGLFTKAVPDPKTYLWKDGALDTIPRTPLPPSRTASAELQAARLGLIRAMDRIYLAGMFVILLLLFISIRTTRRRRVIRSRILPACALITGGAAIACAILSVVTIFRQIGVEVFLPTAEGSIRLFPDGSSIIFKTQNILSPDDRTELAWQAKFGPAGSQPHAYYFHPLFRSLANTTSVATSSRIVVLSVPLWAECLTGSILPALWFCWRRTRLERSNTACKRCGYDVRMSPERCPECGSAVAGT